MPGHRNQPVKIEAWKSVAQRGQVVRALDLKSGDLEFKSRSDQLLDLWQIVSVSTPRLRLYIAALIHTVAGAGCSKHA